MTIKMINAMDYCDGLNKMTNTIIDKQWASSMNLISYLKGG